MVGRLPYQDLEKSADRIEAAITRLGSALRIENLARALLTPVFKPAHKVTFQISATPNKRYHEQFRKEMAAQLKDQQRRLNAFNIDRWVARIDVYKTQSFEYFKKLDRLSRPAVAKELSAKLKEAGDDMARRDKELKAVRAKLQKLIDAAPPLTDEEVQELATLKLQEKALTREQRRARNLDKPRQKLADFLDDNGTLNDLTKAQAKRFVALAKQAKVVGRSGDEKLWKEIHAAAIREVFKTMGEEEEWQGLKVYSWEKLAPLHNPDQVASGHGKIADITPVKKPTSDDDKKALKAWKEYVDKVRAFVGPSWVNSIIGGSWGNAILEAKKEIVQKYPPPTFPLWMMNIALGWVQKG
jgi:hypothetical protein